MEHTLQVSVSRKQTDLCRKKALNESQTAALSDDQDLNESGSTKMAAHPLALSRLLFG